MSERARAFGVLGCPVAHSRSPAMHDAAFARLGLPHRYFAFHVDAAGLPAALAGARALGLGGLNLTLPHKQAALGLVDIRTAAAERIGAVNTVCFEDGRIVGDNTDAEGFGAALRELGGGAPRRAVVLGSGGASRSVVDALQHERTASIAWVSRDPSALPSGPWRGIGWSELADALDGADLLVNTTTVGMKDGPADFPVSLALERLASDARVVDIVYPRPSAGLLQQADALGLRTQDGLPMLLWQGVRALERWLSMSLSASVVDAMRAAIGAAPPHG